MEAEHSKGKRKVKEKLDIVFSILNSKSTMGARTRDPSHIKLHFDSATWMHVSEKQAYLSPTDTEALIWEYHFLFTAVFGSLMGRCTQTDTIASINKSQWWPFVLHSIRHKFCLYKTILKGCRACAFREKSPFIVRVQYHRQFRQHQSSQKMLLPEGDRQLKHVGYLLVLDMCGEPRALWENTEHQK